MANCCIDCLKCVSKNKDELIRLSKILERKDPEYATGLFDGGSEDILEEDGYYTMLVNGWTKWSLDPFIGIDEEYKGVKYVGLDYLLKNICPNTAIEVLAEETGCGYAGWLLVYNKGEHLEKSTDCYDPFVESYDEAEEILLSAMNDGSITEEQMDASMSEIKDEFGEDDCFTMVIGGYEFEFGKPDEIFNGTSRPVERKNPEIIS